MCLSDRSGGLRNKGYTRIKYTGIKWSQLISATSITHLQGSRKDLLFILHRLHLAGSPVEELSIIPWRSSNIVLPIIATEDFKLSDNELICLPHLRTLIIDGIDSELVLKLSFPRLRYFKLLWTYRVYSSEWRSILPFMTRAPSLGILEIEVIDLFGLGEFLADTITAVPSLMEIQIHLRLMKTRLGHEIDPLLLGLARHTRMGCKNLEMIVVWLDWEDTTSIRVPEPWGLSTSDCGCVARLYINNM